jgi:uncharacterized protein
LATAQGDTKAQRDLGYRYFYGLGVKTDRTKAVYWYKKAAAKNDPKALYNLGLCHQEGDGVKQSHKWAMHYFDKFAKLGHDNAKKSLKKLADLL